MILLVLLAFLLDLILGDPYSWPHPVKAIGHFITFFQKRWNKPVFSETKRRRLGIYLWFLTIASTAFCAIVASADRNRPLCIPKLYNVSSEKFGF